jgi:hypothetical protein
LLINRTACSDTAMTGEISLRGLRAARRRHQGEGRRCGPAPVLPPSSCRRATATIRRRSRRPRATPCAFCGPSGSRT